MKRICLVLASLAAIALLSCSSLEDSNFSAENLKFPQSQTLEKALPSDEISDKVTQSSASETYAVRTYETTLNCNPSSASVIVSVGLSATSSEVPCIASGLPSGSTIAGIQFTTGPFEANGTILTNYAIIKKDGLLDTIAWNGNNSTPIPVPPSTVLNGLNANGTYYFSFNATCLKGLNNTTLCTKKYNRIQLIVHYQL